MKKLLSNKLLESMLRRLAKARIELQRQIISCETNVLYGELRRENNSSLV